MYTLDNVGDAVTRQGEGLYKLENRVEGIVKGVNAQANGLRQAHAEIAQLKQVVGQLLQALRMGAAARPVGQQQMRMVNPLPENVRALPSRIAHAEVDDESADFDFEPEDFDDDESEAG